MLVSVITRYAVTTRLEQTSFAETNTFGTQIIEEDHTEFLTTTTYPNNQSFGSQEIEGAASDELTATKFTETNTFGTQIIEVDTGDVSNGLYLDGTPDAMLISLTDYAKYRS
jgi:hypothetical protein